MFSELCDELQQTTGRADLKHIPGLLNEIVKGMHFSGQFDKDKKLETKTLQSGSGGLYFTNSPNTRAVLTVYNTRLGKFYNKVEIGKGMQAPENYYHYYRTDGGFILSTGAAGDSLTIHQLTSPSLFKYYPVGARPAVLNEGVWTYLKNGEYVSTLNDDAAELEARNKVTSWAIEEAPYTAYTGAYAKLMAIDGRTEAAAALRTYEMSLADFARANRAEGYGT